MRLSCVTCNVGTVEGLTHVERLEFLDRHVGHTLHTFPDRCEPARVKSLDDIAQDLYSPSDPKPAHQFFSAYVLGRCLILFGQLNDEQRRATFLRLKNSSGYERSQCP
jgi:hypothetical protein